MDKYTNLPKKILRYNVESLTDENQTRFWNYLKENAPLDDFGLNLLEYKLVIAFSSSETPYARYCHFKDDTLYFEDFLFETAADSVEKLGEVVSEALDSLMALGFLSENGLWITENKAFNGSTITEMSKYK